MWISNVNKFKNGTPTVVLVDLRQVQYIATSGLCIKLWSPQFGHVNFHYETEEECMEAAWKIAGMLKAQPAVSIKFEEPKSSAWSVDWHLEVDPDDASTPTEAAKIAWEHMRANGSIANYFTVTESGRGNRRWRVDLYEKTETLL